MAGWKIGLDFGTHYTKICIVDSSDKRNKTYRFQKFLDQNGDCQFVLPSVVQLNKDRTLSYGYVDNDNALVVEGLPEKDPPQKPMEPEYRSYQQFPELAKPEREQFIHDDGLVEYNFWENHKLNKTQSECISLFDELYKQQTWGNVRPVYVKAVINSFTMEDIKGVNDENGETDIRALVEKAVSRSYTHGREIYMSSPFGMDNIKKQCKELFNTMYRRHAWKNVIPVYVTAVINNFTIADIDSATHDNGDADILALVKMAVSRSHTQGRELFIFSPTRPSNKKKNNSSSDERTDLERKLKKAKKRRAREEQRLYEQALTEYKIKRAQREKEIAQDKKEVDAYNESLRREYEFRIRKWIEYEQRKDKPIPIVFRSFKQMVFSEGYDWRFKEDPMLVAIWYLCYVFFELDIEYGTQNLTVCMGTSSGRGNWEINKKKATQIILTVYDLIERVFDHDKEKFLSATIDELKKVTEIKPFTQEAKEENQIFVFPEAFANLNPLAKRKRFGTGINAVVDIGGGTTDISIFIAPLGEEVKIFDYVSIPYGVNAIESKGRDAHYGAVKNRMDYFSKKIKYHAQKIGVRHDAASEIIDKRPIVFTGGGSMRPELRKPYLGFTDVIHIGSTLLDHYSIDDAQQIASKIPLLSTALGLALCGSDDKAIPLIDYKTLFENVEEAYSRMSREELLRYEHGITDD